MTLTFESFRTFFFEVTGRQPFQWQERLARDLCAGRFPERIDVPTGMGKTSIILAWVFALAFSLDSNKFDQRSLRFPLRLFYVVDRRIIVDGAFELAQRVAKHLQEARPGMVAAEVASTLSSFSGNPARPLEVVRMRGGLNWESRWLDRPHQPAVVASTVDQFGSRLLFRGYGVSSSMLPLNAALCGSHGWVVVDEAHISEPLVATVSRVVQLQTNDSRMALLPLQATVMSATGRGPARGAVITADLEEEEKGHPLAAAAARARLTVSKPATLEQIEVRGKGTEQFRHLGRQLAELAVRRFKERPGKYGLLCNTVQTARAAFETLRADIPECRLLTGRIREFERQQLAPEVIAAFGSGREPAGRPEFLVATQTIEVGADLDFDAIITECAPLSSLVQRFGRVRRMGLDHQAESVVAFSEAVHGQDPVYGTASKGTWELLGKVWPSRKADFSFSNVRHMRAEATVATEPPQPPAPPLLGAHIERWVQTSPIPLVDQPVAPFLHGVQSEAPPQVLVAWRAVPKAASASVSESEQWAAWLELAPISEWETVAVPLTEVRAFVSGEKLEWASGDVELASEKRSRPDGNPEAAVGVRGAVLTGADEPPRLLTSPLDLTPFVTVVLDSFEGGHDRWGWNGLGAGNGERVVPDIADLVPSKRPRSLRMAPSIAASHAPDARPAIEEAWLTLSPEDVTATAPPVLRTWAELVGGPLGDLYREAADGIAGGSWRVLLPAQRDEGGWDLEEAGRPVARVVEVASTGPGFGTEQSDNDDISSSLTGSAAVSLFAHGERVGALARSFSEKLGLGEELMRAVELAARLHDIGKAEPRFQAALYDGDRLAALAGELRAKSGLDPRDPAARVAARLAGLPRGFRHEAVSARLLDCLREVEPELFREVDFELVRHLVLAHHGRSRPLLPAIADPGPETTRLTLNGRELEAAGSESQVDWEHPRKFRDLNQRYGWWGLAMLETIVRLADMKDSELAAASFLQRTADVATGRRG